MSRQLKSFITLLIEAVIVIALCYLVLLAFGAIIALLAEPINNALWGAWESVNGVL
jgi:hypothetical protein